MPLYTPATPGGSSTQLQYNNAGVLGGISGATTDGTNTTFASGNLLATSPKITTGISDTNGNSEISLTATASAVYGLTLANAALLGTVALGVTAPTQVASAVAGTPLSITAQAAVAGASNAGAAAGGAVTITSGAAARLTSGNANGGSINLVGGAGIGTGTTGSINITGSLLASSEGSLMGAPSANRFNIYALGLSSGTAIQSGEIRWNSTTNMLRVQNGFVQMGSAVLLQWSSGDPSSVACDIGFGRAAAGRVEVDSGAAGTLRDIIARQLFAGGDNAGLASSTSLTNATDGTVTNAYTVKGGQVATTANTGWLKIYVGTAVAWVPYWQNATP